MFRFLILVLALCTVTLVVAEQPKPKDAFLLGKKSTLKKEYNYLAISPLVAAPALQMPEKIQAQVFQAVVEGLQKKGFKVLPVSHYQNIAQSFHDQYSSVSAENRDNVNKLVKEHTYRELFFQYPVDGYISLGVLPVSAPFRKNKAEWHGTSQKIKHKGDGFFGKDYEGHIAASVIKMTISSRDGEPLFHWASGIELLMSRNGSKLEQLPASGFWQDEKRIRKATKYLLKPM